MLGFTILRTAISRQKAGKIINFFNSVIISYNFHPESSRYTVPLRGMERTSARERGIRCDYQGYGSTLYRHLKHLLAQTLDKNFIFVRRKPLSKKPLLEHNSHFNCHWSTMHVNVNIYTTGKNLTIFKYLKTFSNEEIPGSEIFIVGNNIILRLYICTSTKTSSLSRECAKYSYPPPPQRLQDFFILLVKGRCHKNFLSVSLHTDSTYLINLSNFIG